MQCLYCNKKLGLFASKKHPFCSEVHETAYNDEQVGLAMRRVMDPLFTEPVQKAPLQVLPTRAMPPSQAPALEPAEDDVPVTVPLPMHASRKADPEPEPPAIRALGIPPQCDFFIRQARMEPVSFDLTPAASPFGFDTSAAQLQLPVSSGCLVDDEFDLEMDVPEDELPGSYGIHPAMELATVGLPVVPPAGAEPPAEPAAEPGEPELIFEPDPVFEPEPARLVYLPRAAMLRLNPADSRNERAPQPASSLDPPQLSCRYSFATMALAQGTLEGCAEPAIYQWNAAVEPVALQASATPLAIPSSTMFPLVPAAKAFQFHFAPAVMGVAPAAPASPANAPQDPLPHALATVLPAPGTASPGLALRPTPPFDEAPAPHSIVAGGALLEPRKFAFRTSNPAVPAPKSLQFGLADIVAGMTAAVPPASRLEALHIPLVPGTRTVFPVPVGAPLGLALRPAPPFGEAPDTYSAVPGALPLAPQEVVFRTSTPAVPAPQSLHVGFTNAVVGMTAVPPASPLEDRLEPLVPGARTVFPVPAGTPLGLALRPLPPFREAPAAHSTVAGALSPESQELVFRTSPPAVPALKSLHVGFTNIAVGMTAVPPAAPLKAQRGLLIPGARTVFPAPGAAPLGLVPKLAPPFDETPAAHSAVPGALLLEHEELVFRTSPPAVPAVKSLHPGFTNIAVGMTAVPPAAPLKAQHGPLIPGARTVFPLPVGAPLGLALRLAPLFDVAPAAHSAVPAARLLEPQELVFRTSTPTVPAAKSFRFFMASAVTGMTAVPPASPLKTQHGPLVPGARMVFPLPGGRPLGLTPLPAPPFLEPHGITLITRLRSLPGLREAPAKLRVPRLFLRAKMRLRIDRRSPRQVAAWTASACPPGKPVLIGARTWDAEVKQPAWLEEEIHCNPLSAAGWKRLSWRVALPENKFKPAEPRGRVAPARSPVRSPKVARSSPGTRGSSSSVE